MKCHEVQKNALQKEKRGIIVCLLLILILSVSLASARENKGEIYPEPIVRPNIRSDAVWDSQLGMYVSGDLIKGEDGRYYLNPALFYSERDDASEELWKADHSNSTDVIDRAILKALESPVDTNPLLSAVSPHDSAGLMAAMGEIPASAYGEVWKRICTENVYRPQKIAALESFLGIDLGFGLYDQLGQKLWWEEFTALKKQIPEDVNKENAETYGALLLLPLQKKAETLKEAETEALTIILEKMKEYPSCGIKELPASDPTAAVKWLKAQTALISVIKEIADTDYNWTD